MTDFTLAQNDTAKSLFPDSVRAVRPPPPPVEEAPVVEEAPAVAESVAVEVSEPGLLLASGQLDIIALSIVFVLLLIVALGLVLRQEQKARDQVPAGSGMGARKTAEEARAELAAMRKPWQE